MKLQFILTIIAIALILFTFGCAHTSDPCDNKLLKQIPSPDGNLILATYHRECPSKFYTVAAIEKPRKFLQTRGEAVCQAASWGGQHSIEAGWKDVDNIFISTTDRLEKIDFITSKDLCGGRKNLIKISYNVQFRNEQ
jgi:hypothetical protein